jgi:hypothetical protein
MLMANFNTRKCSLLLALVGTLAIQSASADIVVSSDFPVGDSQQTGKVETAKSLLESYRADVLAEPAAKSSDVSTKGFTVAKN